MKRQLAVKDPVRFSLAKNCLDYCHMISFNTLPYRTYRPEWSSQVYRKYQPFYVHLKEKAETQKELFEPIVVEVCL